MQEEKTCARLERFIKQCQADAHRVKIPEQYREDLRAMAAKGDCQFSDRCKEWRACPLAKQHRIGCGINPVFLKPVADPSSTDSGNDSRYIPNNIGR